MGAQSAERAGDHCAITSGWLGLYIIHKVPLRLQRVAAGSAFLLIKHVVAGSAFSLIQHALRSEADLADLQGCTTICIACMA